MKPKVNSFSIETESESGGIFYLYFRPHVRDLIVNPFIQLEFLFKKFLNLEISFALKMR